MSDEELGRHIRELDWDSAIMSHFRRGLQMSLARHPKISPALSYGEGEKLVSELSASLTYDAHRIIDPDYDQ